MVSFIGESKKQNETNKQNKLVVPRDRVKWVKRVKTYKLPATKILVSWGCNVQHGNYSE